MFQNFWAEKYHHYLGVTVPDNTGALQDVHWSWGEFGYFPHLCFGSAFGAQFKHAMIEDGMDFDGFVPRRPCTHS